MESTKLLVLISLLETQKMVTKDNALTLAWAVLKNDNSEELLNKRSRIIFERLKKEWR